MQRTSTSNNIGDGVLPNPQFPYIPFDPTKTNSAKDPMQIRIYENSVKKYGRQHGFSLEIASDKQCILKLNYTADKKEKVEKDPANILVKAAHNFTYTFVIRPTEAGAPELVLGSGSHRFIAEKASWVYLAGKIEFANNEIKTIYPESGGYHFDVEGQSNEKLAEFDRKIEAVLQAVGLPTTAFEHFSKEKDCSKEVAYELDAKFLTQIGFNDLESEMPSPPLKQPSLKQSSEKIRALNPFVSLLSQESLKSSSPHKSLSPQSISSLWVNRESLSPANKENAHSNSPGFSLKKSID